VDRARFFNLAIRSTVILSVGGSAILTSPAAALKPPPPKPTPPKQAAAKLQSAQTRSAKTKRTKTKTPARPAVSARQLSGSDALWTRNAFRAADRGKWQTFNGFAGRIANPLAKKLLTWRRLRSAGSGAGFDEINTFITDNPDWPSRRRMRGNAEAHMSMGPAETFAWFGTRRPVSAIGGVKLGAALLASGETAKGAAAIRKAWIEGDFSRAQSRAVHRRYKHLLRPEDHRRRLDRLLWNGRHGAVRRMLYLVSPDWQKLATARSALRRRAGNVDYLVGRVPPGLRNHPGLIYERLRWRRRKNKDNAIDMARDLPTGLSHSKKWWTERSTLSRRALRKGHISAAYIIASHHGLQAGGAAYAEAEWLSGWIALRFLKDHDDALEHFKRMHASVKFPVSIARGAYWVGRALETADDADGAVTWYRKAAAHPLTYYGQLAFARLRPGKSLELPGVVTLPDAPLPAFDNHELVKVIEILGDLALHDFVRGFVNRLMELSDKPNWWARTAKLARLSGRPDLSIRIAKQAARNGTPLPREAFPVVRLPALPKRAKGGPVERPLALAVIRQESAFRVTAKSHAGARGLMQLMPATAKVVSRKLKLRYVRSRLVTSPKYNMTLGQAYLAELLDTFNGSYPLTLAGYNAGPHRSKRWIKQHGDPRDADVDAVDWVEMIPFDETRNYVQRVLENVQIYRLGLAKTKVPLRLEKDLHFASK